MQHSYPGKCPRARPRDRARGVDGARSQIKGGPSWPNDGGGESRSLEDMSLEESGKRFLIKKALAR